MSGKIVKLLIAQDIQSPMHNVNQIVLEEGKGIFGDRYYYKRGTFSKGGEIEPHRDVTLIEQERIDTFNEEFQSEVPYEDFRRNIVVSNCDLNSLVGKEFQVGDVILKGIKLCEPCKYLSKQLNNDNFVKKMLHKAGLRAQIIRSGSINLSSQVEIEID